MLTCSASGVVSRMYGCELRPGCSEPGSCDLSLVTIQRALPRFAKLSRTRCRGTKRAPLRRVLRRSAMPPAPSSYREKKGLVELRGREPKRNKSIYFKYLVLSPIRTTFHICVPSRVTVDCHNQRLTREPERKASRQGARWRLSPASRQDETSLR